MRTPIFKDSRPWYGQDPFVVNYNNTFLFIESNDEIKIQIRQAATLESLQTAFPQTVYFNREEQQVWAPELHNLNSRWYIFYSSSNGQNYTHRNKVLESESINPFGPYHSLGQIGPDIWGIDNTLFQFNNHYYNVWSGWEDDETEFFPTQQNLYIAPMSLSKESSFQRVKISSPDLPWEGNINEGPQWVQACVGQGLLFSANSSWIQDYCTGFLELFGDNPLNPEHWAKDFKPLGTNVGHAQFFEDRMIYHKKLSHLPGWQDRAIVIGAPLDEYVYQTGELFQP